jgi:hypothetical protein
MATNTTDSGRFLLNLNSLNNVITSASGNGSAMTAALSNLQFLVNTSNYSMKMNTITPYSGSNINVTGNLNLSNAGIFFNSNLGLNSNTVNGVPYLAFQTSGVERMRLTSNSFGINTKTPLATLDVNGAELIRGNIYVSTMGMADMSTFGNVFADGSMFATGFYQPSDPALKTDVFPYIPRGLPQPVEFTWKASGTRDIGVLADEVMSIEPSCVIQRGAMKHVDYAKLVVLCLAEIHSLRSTVSTLVAKV